jgi:hypothetical protein
MTAKWLQNIKGHVLYADLFPLRPGILGGIKPHYISLVDDYADLTVPNTNGEALNLAAVRCEACPDISDPEIRTHIMGNCERLPYSVSVYNTGDIWDDKFRALRSVISNMRRDGTVGMDRVFKELSLTPEDFKVLETLEEKEPYKFLDRAFEVTGKIFRLSGKMKLDQDPLSDQVASYKERLVRAVLPLLNRTPPVRVNIPRSEDESAESLLMVTRKFSSEYRPSVLFGWGVDSSGGDKQAQMWRESMREGNPHLRRFLNYVDAEPYEMYGVPSYLPYGLSGGLMAIGIEMNQDTTYVDTWGSSSQRELWLRVAEELGEEGVDEVFNGFVPRNRIKAEDPFMQDDGMFCTSLSPEDLAIRCAKQEIEKRGSFTHLPDKDEMRSISINDKVFVTYTAFNSMNSDEYPLPMITAGQPVTLMMVYGGMRVTSPRGITVEMGEGEAALVPASATGNYTLEPIPELAADYPNEPRHAFIEIMGAQTFKARDEIAEWARLYGPAFLKGLLGQPLDD